MTTITLQGEVEAIQFDGANPHEVQAWASSGGAVASTVVGTGSVAEVQVNGIAVHPGDWVVGVDTGVYVVAAGLMGAILKPPTRPAPKKAAAKK